MKQKEKKTKLQLKCNEWSFIQIEIYLNPQRELSAALT